MAEQPSPPRAIGLAGAVLINLNGVIGSGIFALPALILAGVGTIAPLVVLAFAVLVLPPMLVLGKLSTGFDQSGGPQLYVERAFGPLAGFLAGWGLLGQNLAARAANFLVLVAYLAALFPVFDQPLVRSLTVAGLIGCFTALSMVGTRASVGGLWVGTLFKLGPILLVCVAGLLTNGVPQTVRLPVFSDVEAIALLLAYAYSGGHLVTVAAGEVADARRTVFRAILLNLAVIALFYAFVVWAYAAIDPPDVNADRPLASAGQAVLGTFGLAAISVAAIFSTGTNQLSYFVSMPRVLFGMAERGLLPAGLGRVHPRFLTPANAILAYAALVLVLALSGTFATLATFMVALEALVLLAAVLALPVLWRRRHFTITGWRAWAWGAVIAAAVAFELWMEAQAPVEALLPTLGVLLAGSLVYLLARQRGRTKKA
ncbi:APC family permease [Alteraurantiacibacter buctensis]|uniref:Amino acid permease n=1 Tax=Alteraurantiacibacter buctensis TaxID=1503981 RepID=A0A844YW69_9SPHN|nr:APC family permease [Alteraurantiacibacter buctensis]MXO70317.1 amino acid permease [Alteraurantiacibacter buctensis]